MQVLEGQSLLDLVIKQHGTLEALFDVAALNNLGLSQALQPGTFLSASSTEYAISTPGIRAKVLPVRQTKTIISEGQCLLDVVIQEAGSLEGLFNLAALNGLTISADLAGAQVLQVSPGIIAKPDLVKYFSDRKVRVNTGSLSLEPDGIFWVDGDGFYVADGNDNYILAQL